jgi:tetratricopeptide (TPR) repeat protein
MDLYFQGRALWNKGWTPECSAQARGLFERAFALDPKNIGAMVGMAAVDLVVGASALTDDVAAHLAAAEATLVKALSLAPTHAAAHLVLGSVQMFTNRAAQGIAECERALALNRNLAAAHAQIGIAKYLMGRAAETEAHINEALRLSPRDIGAFSWLQQVGGAKLLLTADAEAISWFRRSIEANRNNPIAHFGLAAALALLGRLDEARAAARAGLALNPSFTIRRLHEFRPSDNPTYLAMRERIYQGLRMAGVPEG